MLALRHGYEELATSFSHPLHKIVHDQFSPSLSHFPTDSVMASVHNIAEMARGANGTETLNQSSVHSGISINDLAP